MTPRAIVEMMTQMVYAAGKWEDLMKDGELEWIIYNQYLQYVVWYWLMFHSPPRHTKEMNPPLHTQLDPCVGSGRFLLVATEMMPKANLVLFGIEINLALYRSCLVNMATFSNHPYSIICADTLRIDPKWSGPSSKMWDLGNQWTPPDMSIFYFQPSPIGPKNFSLKAFTEIQKEP